PTTTQREQAAPQSKLFKTLQRELGIPSLRDYETLVSCPQTANGFLDVAGFGVDNHNAVLVLKRVEYDRYICLPPEELAPRRLRSSLNKYLANVSGICLLACQSSAEEAESKTYASIERTLVHWAKTHNVSVYRLTK